MKFFTSICALSAVALATQEPNKVEKRQIGDPNIPYAFETCNGSHVYCKTDVPL